MKTQLGTLIIASALALSGFVACSSKTKTADTAAVQEAPATSTPAPVAQVPSDLGASSSGFSH